MLNFWELVNLCNFLSVALCRPGNREAYVCSLYMTTKKTNIIDNLCYLMFCQNKQKNEMLPPATDCLLQHLEHSNYQAFGWSHALEAMQDLGSQEGHGWVHMRDGNFSYYCQSQTHQHQLAYLSWRRASARHLPASKTASVATQDLLTQKFASAWQTMKHVVTPMVWPASVTQKKAMKRVALKRNRKIVNI